MRWIGVAAGVLILASTALGQQPGNAPSAADPTSVQKPAVAANEDTVKKPLPDACTPDQIREYLRITNTMDMVRNLLGSMIRSSRATSAPYFPSAFWDDMERSLLEVDYVSAYVPIYQEHLTRTDMQQILDFYKSAAGSHLLDAQPMMIAEAQFVLKQKGQEIGAQVYERHKDVIEALKAKYQQQSSGTSTSPSAPVTSNPPK